MKFKNLSKPFLFLEEVMFSSLQGCGDELNLNFIEIKCKDESLGSHFIPSHSTFKKFPISLNFTQSITHNQTNNQSDLFNITFQNLEFWDVKNLPHLKLISSSRFEEASKKRLGVGGLLANILVGRVQCATTLKSMGMVQTKLMYSILLGCWCRCSHILRNSSFTGVVLVGA